SEQTYSTALPTRRSSDLIPPMAIVGIPAVTDYHSTMGRGVITLEPTVHLFTGSASDIEGQRALADYANPVGAKSIRAAIEGDKRSEEHTSELQSREKLVC